MGKTLKDRLKALIKRGKAEYERNNPRGKTTKKDRAKVKQETKSALKEIS
jgi:hypothetical protein